MFWKNLARLLVGLVASVCLQGHAATGFTGGYDYSTWTSAETYGGATYSSIDSSQQVLTLMEPDSYPSTPWAPQEFTFSHAALGSGTVKFDWSFNALIDACCSGLNFYVNSTLYNLTGGHMGNPYKFEGPLTAGTFSVAVNAGDTLAFAAFSADSCCGATTNVISNFSAPDAVAAVPEPETYGLMLAGLAMVAVAKRRKKAAGRE